MPESKRWKPSYLKPIYDCMEGFTKKYDKQGRVIEDYSTITGTMTIYEYGNGWKKITMLNDRNRSNHTTVIEQNMAEDGSFMDVLKIEDGDVYTIKTHYNGLGKEVQYERINKIKKTNLVKTTHHSEFGETFISIINYDGKKEIGFKADIKRLRKG
jgi:hypothetical protein